jgi:hypothetical protein
VTVEPMLPCTGQMGWVHVVIVALQVLQGIVTALLSRQVRRNGVHHRGRARRGWE